MAEGLFTAEQCSIPGLAPDVLKAAIVRVLPRTLLLLDWAVDADEVRAKARNETLPDGSERWLRFFTRAEAEQIGDPSFRMGMVRFEFSQHLSRGGTLPAELPLDGGGSGFAITAHGHVLTNYHLVTSEIGNHRREGGAVGDEVRCRTLRAQVGRATDTGALRWEDAREVWLVSNPPQRDAIHDRGDNTGELRHDMALLRIAPAPGACLRLANRLPVVGEPVWMAGFPLRTARSVETRTQLDYEDADGTLRISKGTVLRVEGSEYFETDCDGSMGNSGSPVLAADGTVLGFFSRAAGDGPRNAFAYGHVTRIQVSALLARRTLQLRDVLASDFA